MLEVTGDIVLAFRFPEKITLTDARHIPAPAAVHRKQDGYCGSKLGNVFFCLVVDDPSLEHH
jgi:hypothetical protein